MKFLILSLATVAVGVSGGVVSLQNIFGAFPSVYHGLFPSHPFLLRYGHSSSSPGIWQTLIRSQPRGAVTQQTVLSAPLTVKGGVPNQVVTLNHAAGSPVFYRPAPVLIQAPVQTPVAVQVGTPSAVAPVLLKAAVKSKAEAAPVVHHLAHTAPVTYRVGPPTSIKVKADGAVAVPVVQQVAPAAPVAYKVADPVSLPVPHLNIQQASPASTVHIAGSAPVPVLHQVAAAAPVTLNVAPAPTVSGVAPVAAAVAPTQSQYHAQDEIGQYSFGYYNSHSSRAETRDLTGTVRGAFSYVDPNGHVQTQHYIADTHGFRVAGTNLPVGHGSQAVASQQLSLTPAAPVVHSGVPVVHAGAPVVRTGAPVVQASVPAVHAGAPVVQVVQASAPVVKASVPVVHASAPVVQASLPVAQASLPVVQASVPVAQASLPVVHASAPLVHAGAPIILGKSFSGSSPASEEDSSKVSSDVHVVYAEPVEADFDATVDATGGAGNVANSAEVPSITHHADAVDDDATGDNTSNPAAADDDTDH